MNKNIRTMMLATAGAALLAAQAQAQSFTYTVGDLLLDFRQASSPTTDLTIDLGPLSNFKNQTSVVSLNQFSSILTSTFGANLSGLDWSVASADSANDLWMSRTRNPASGNYNNQALAASTAWTRFANSINASTATLVRSTGNNGAASGTVVGNQAVTTPDTATFSYHHFVGANANWQGNFQGNVESATGAAFTGSSIQREDFYELLGGSGAGSYLGYFQLGADATLDFVPGTLAVAVPEPMTYGLMSGIGLLLVGLRQQFRRLRV